MNAHAAMRAHTLAVLEHEPGDGYTVGRRLEDRAKGTHRDRFRFDWSALYPTLHELEGEGLLESHEAPAGHGARRVYRLTDSGAEAVARARHREGTRPAARTEPARGMP